MVLAYIELQVGHEAMLRTQPGDVNPRKDCTKKQGKPWETSENHEEQYGKEHKRAVKSSVR